MAALHQYSKELVANFIFRFHATCLKIEDLFVAGELYRFVRALVPKVRVRVELRGPRGFTEAAMFAKHADAMIARVSGQDTPKSWQK